MTYEDAMARHYLLANLTRPLTADEQTEREGLQEWLEHQHELSTL